MSDTEPQSPAPEAAAPAPAPKKKKAAVAKAAPKPAKATVGPQVTRSLYEKQDPAAVANPKRDARQMVFTNALIGMKEGEPEGSVQVVKYGRMFFLGCAALVVLAALIGSA